MVSLGNFAFGLLIAHRLGPAQFGVFALVWAIVVFAFGIQWALVTSPMQSRLPHLAESDRHGFCWALIAQSVAIGLATSGVAVLVAARTLAGGLSAIDSIVMALSIVAIVIQDFVRRWLLAVERVRWALAGDFCRHFGAMLAIQCLPSEWRAALPTVMAVIGIAALVASLPFCGDMRRTRGAWAIVLQHARTHARTGRWLLPFVAVQAAIGAVPLYAINAAVGPAGAGGYRAAIYLMAPLIVLSEALETFLPLRASESMTHGGISALKRLLTQWTWLVIAPSVAYLTAVNVAGEWLFCALFGASYAVFAPLLIPLSVAMLLQVATYMLNVYHRAIGNPRGLLIAELAAAASLAACYLIFPIGRIGEGAAVFAVASQGVKLAVLVYRTHGKPEQLFA
jgi:O-antigen/teichoic acid export membrane protein